MELRSPKVSNETRDVHPYWYPYYTGYTEAFVEDIIRSYKFAPSSTILDPWNGSGTTTFVARKLGFTSFGFDLNPALVIVAKGRLLDAGVVPSLGPLTGEILSLARLSRHENSGHPEPLAIWFDAAGAHYIRSVEQAIRRMFVSSRCESAVFSWSSLSSLSTLACFFYVALFEAVRCLLSANRGSNPTWTRRQMSGPKLHLDPTTFNTIYARAVDRLAGYISGRAVHPARSMTMCHVDISAAECPRVAPSTVDVVISSPPYCTRIDYAVMSYPELAVLGCPADDRLHALRRRMLGTPTMSGSSSLEAMLEWGPRCVNLLGAIRAHPSYASARYYHRYFQQYFFSLWECLKVINTCLRPRATIALLVQDSYYKELRVDLAAILEEMGTQLGWRYFARHDFVVPLSMARLHVAVRKAKRPSQRCESLVMFRAAGR